MRIANGFLFIFFTFIILHNNLLSQSSPVEPQRVNVVTLQDALMNVRKIIADFPSNDSAAIHAYEYKNSYVLVKCAKVLYDNARQQILMILQEIDKRKAYWQYQKDHQWWYFFTKNPVKWVTGEKQEVEVNNNLEVLESYQGELYVLLGLLAESGNMYEQNYKTTFVKDPKKGYEWIDNLVDLLARIKTSPDQENIPFLARAMRLKLKLEKLNYFKEDILLEIKETQIPTSLERKWLTYGAVMAGLGLGYNSITAAQLKSSFDYLVGEANKFLVTPVQNLVKEVLVTEQRQESGELLVPQADIIQAKKSIRIFIDDLRKTWFGWWYSKDIEGIVNEKTGDIDMARFQALSDKLMKKWRWQKTGEAKLLYGQLLGLQGIGHLEEQLVSVKKQYAGIGKIAFLTPTIASAFLAYSGYQKLTAKDYGPLRRALLEINSLFVDQTKPLNDEQYGKMIYLLYNLKRRIRKELSQRGNLQTDFLQDLERIESKEFDSAAKRRIIDDMFRKYSFLGVH